MTNSDGYFSDREFGSKAKTEQKMNPTVWAGIVTLVNSLTNKGAFGNKWSEQCPDSQVICGTDFLRLKSAIEAEIDGLTWPLESSSSVLESPDGVPETLLALDLIEFVWRNVANPSNIDYHKFCRHYHLTFDVQAGRAEFRDDVNRILARNGMAYELSEDGQIKRCASVILGETLARTSFRTGDSELDVMLEDSKKKFSTQILKSDAKGLNG